MNSLSDQELLCEYTGRQSEAAFAELVRRHLDFVYSAALRMVRDSSLAEDVTQGVFLALAQNARQLGEHPVLAGWLHRTTQNLASKAVRSEVRRRAREQEAAAMNELFSEEPDATWEQIAPQLDDALSELSESDRDALLLRYFQRRSAREVGLMLGLSDEAAQKRVSRAVERLRDIFARRGVTVAVGRTCDHSFCEGRSRRAARIVRHHCRHHNRCNHYCHQSPHYDHNSEDSNYRRNHRRLGHGNLRGTQGFNLAGSG